MNKKGNITIIHLVGWGLAISTFLGGIFWAKVNATDNNLDNFKAKVADDKVVYSQDIATIKTQVANVKEVVDRIDRKLK